MRFTAFGARVVLVGMGSPRIDLPAYSVSTEERTLIGSFCYPAQDFRDTAEWVGRAPEVLAGLVDGRVDLPGATEAFTNDGTPFDLTSLTGDIDGEFSCIADFTVSNDVSERTFSRSSGPAASGPRASAARRSIRSARRSCPPTRWTKSSSCACGPG